jgi:hypothetical protein
MFMQIQAHRNPVGDFQERDEGSQAKLQERFIHIGLDIRSADEKQCNGDCRLATQAEGA